LRLNWLQTTSCLQQATALILGHNVGEPVKPVPKEQPPRKLSGQRDRVVTKTLERGVLERPPKG
jgi:hypothetical protein